MISSGVSTPRPSRERPVLPNEPRTALPSGPALGLSPSGPAQDSRRPTRIQAVGSATGARNATRAGRSRSRMERATAAAPSEWAMMPPTPSAQSLTALIASAKCVTDDRARPDHRVPGRRTRQRAVPGPVAATQTSRVDPRGHPSHARAALRGRHRSTKPRLVRRPRQP
jgi:hypothetical protein